jgi:anti-anti-sigma regulatory factor
MPSKVGLMVCKNFERELITVLEAEQPHDVILLRFPVQCEPPGLSWETLAKVIAAGGDACSQIHILGGSCFVRLAALPPELQARCRVHHLEQCLEMVAGRQLIEEYQAQGAYVLTPGWLARWRLTVKRWGFEPEMARMFLTESATKLLLLDTGVDEQSGQHLQEFADFAGLPAETVPVGLDYLRLFVRDIVLAWRLEHEKAAARDTLTRANQSSASYSMALDMIDAMAGFTSEEKVIASIIDLFTLLFSPLSVIYASLASGEPDRLWHNTPNWETDEGVIKSRLRKFKGGHEWTEKGNGFRVRIVYNHEELAMVEVEEIAFPEYKQLYLNIALGLVKVCGLAVNNARTYQALKKTFQTIEELSTPIIPVLEQILIMPLVGGIDDQRIQRIRQSLLAGIGQYRPKIVILDITGVYLTDDRVVQSLDKVIQVAQLKGVQTIVTGISEAVAEKIVEMGVDWHNIETGRNLHTGLMVALNRLGIKLINFQTS